MTTLEIWEEKGVWYFNDEEKGVLKEPFVMGSSEIISTLADKEGLLSNSLRIDFSDSAFSGFMYKLKKLDKDGTWTLYGEEATEKIGWLCPVLYLYFNSPPKYLFIRIRE